MLTEDHSVTVISPQSEMSTRKSKRSSPQCIVQHNRAVQRIEINKEKPHDLNMQHELSYNVRDSNAINASLEAASCMFYRYLHFKIRIIMVDVLTFEQIRSIIYTV